MYKSGEKYRTTAQTGDQIELSSKALANSRSNGKGVNLPYIKMDNGSVRYRQSDIDAYMDSRLINHTGEVA